MVRSGLAVSMVAFVAVACSTADESSADGPPSPGSAQASATATATADDDDGQGSSATQASEEATPSPSPDVVATRGEADDLLGTWHDKRNHTLRFLPDGNYDVDRGYTESGTYEFDGDVLIMEPGRSPCEEGAVARYEVRFADDGDTAQLRKIEDPCAVRFGALRLGLEREG